MVNNKAAIKRNRFLSIKGDTREINTPLVAEARRKAGIKGYVTDLNIPPQEVISACHQLFQVEHSFRMTKSDLKARPIFHHTRDSIDAHLTIVFAGLAVSRYIESRTELSIKRFIQKLAPLRTGVIAVGAASLRAKPRIPEDISTLIKKLGVKI
jgi:transposase